MKRLIVLAALATLFGPLIGCSLLNKTNVPSCETCEQPASPGLLGGLQLPRISLPWNRSTQLSEQCNTCNEGFAEVGIGDGSYVSDGYVEGGFVDYGSTSSSSLYDANTVYSGPTVINSGSTSAISATAVGGFSGELLPTPLSPELGSMRK